MAAARRGACAAARGSTRALRCIAGSLGALVLLRLGTNRNAAGKAVGVPAIPAVSALCWVGFFIAIYGTPDPSYSVRERRGSAGFIPGGLAGLFFDQRFGLSRTRRCSSARSPGSRRWCGTRACGGWSAASCCSCCSLPAGGNPLRHVVGRHERAGTVLRADAAGDGDSDRGRAGRLSAHARRARPSLAALAVTVFASARWSSSTADARLQRASEVCAVARMAERRDRSGARTARVVAGQRSCLYRDTAIWLAVFARRMGRLARTAGHSLVERTAALSRQRRPPAYAIAAMVALSIVWTLAGRRQRSKRSGAAGAAAAHWLGATDARVALPDFRRSDTRRRPGDAAHRAATVDRAGRRRSRTTGRSIRSHRCRPASTVCVRTAPIPPAG